MKRNIYIVVGLVLGLGLTASFNLLGNANAEPPDASSPPPDTSPPATDATQPDTDSTPVAPDVTLPAPKADGVTCLSNEECTSGNCKDKVCAPKCATTCGSKVCGDDGCGGMCGECAKGEVCGKDYKCVKPTVAGNDTECSDKKACDNGKSCVNGKCEAKADPKKDDPKPAIEEPKEKKLGDTCKNDPDDCDQSGVCMAGKCVEPREVGESCENNGDCAGTATTCESGKCVEPPPPAVADPCFQVVFSNNDDKGCFAIADLHYRGIYEMDTARKYVGNLLKGKGAEKRLERLNKELLARGKGKYWSGFSQYDSRKVVSKMTPQQLNEAGNKPMTRWDGMHLVVRMDERGGTKTIETQTIIREVPGPCPNPKPTNVD